MKAISVGTDSYINTSEIILISGVNTNPIRNAIQEAKEKNRLWDVTMGRQTRAVIVTKSHVILSSVASETISKRFNEEESKCNT